MSNYSDAILLIAHGSSDLSADSTCSDLFYTELQSRFPGIPVYQAYSAPITLKKIDRDSAQTPVRNIGEAVEQILEDGAARLHVLAAYLNPCLKYSKVLNALEPYRGRFESLTVSAPLLNADADPAILADILGNIIAENISVEDKSAAVTQVILAAHTATPEIVSLWEPVLGKLRQECPVPVSLLYRNGHPNADDYLETADRNGLTLVIPLMLFGGRHLHKDVVEGEKSLQNKLEKAGLSVSTVSRGLGEYPEVRKAFYDKM